MGAVTAWTPVTRILLGEEIRRAERSRPRGLRVSCCRSEKRASSLGHRKLWLRSGPEGLVRSTCVDSSHAVPHSGCLSRAYPGQFVLPGPSRTRPRPALTSPAFFFLPLPQCHLSAVTGPQERKVTPRGVGFGLDSPLLLLRGCLASHPLPRSLPDGSDSSLVGVRPELLFPD